MPIEEAHAIRLHRLAALREQLRGLPEAQTDLTLEIGCGHGHFLTAYAEQHRAEFCVAIDIIRDRLERAARKTTRAALANVAWIRASAEDLLTAWPSHLHLNRHIFILFPDPWPKRRHWKNRLIQPDFLDQLADRCITGATLCFRTDHAEYFAAAHATIAAHARWRIRPEALWPFEQQTVFQAKAVSHQSLVADWRPKSLAGPDA